VSTMSMGGSASDDRDEKEWRARERVQTAVDRGMPFVADDRGPREPWFPRFSRAIVPTPIVEVLEARYAQAAGTLVLVDKLLATSWRGQDVAFLPRASASAGLP
jgi:hypothetical protein